VLLLYESNTDVDYSELWIYIEPMCRIVGGRYATIVRRTPVSGVQGLGRNLNAENNAGRLRTDWERVWRPRKK
jgi:hypothetical protein